MIACIFQGINLFCSRGWQLHFSSLAPLLYAVPRAAQRPAVADGNYFSQGVRQRGEIAPDLQRHHLPRTQREDPLGRGCERVFSCSLESGMPIAIERF